MKKYLILITKTINNNIMLKKNLHQKNHLNHYLDKIKKKLNQKSLPLHYIVNVINVFAEFRHPLYLIFNYQTFIICLIIIVPSINILFNNF